MFNITICPRPAPKANPIPTAVLTGFSGGQPPHALPTLARTDQSEIAPGRWELLNSSIYQPKASPPRIATGVLIYTVDDEPDLTELYTALLTGAGFTVRAFNHRAEALASLETERKKPDLLITDYVGSSMRIETFVSACRVVHPALRILMASGVHESHAGVLLLKPDDFIRKPFTPDEFLRKVNSVSDRAGKA